MTPNYTCRHLLFQDSTALYCFDFVAAHLNLGIVLSDMGLKEQAVQVDMYDMFCCL